MNPTLTHQSASGAVCTVLHWLLQGVARERKCGLAPRPSAASSPAEETDLKSRMRYIKDRITVPNPGAAVFGVEAASEGVIEKSFREDGLRGPRGGRGR